MKLKIELQGIDNLDYTPFEIKTIEVEVDPPQLKCVADAKMFGVSEKMDEPDRETMAAVILETIDRIFNELVIHTHMNRNEHLLISSSTYMLNPSNVRLTSFKIARDDLKVALSIILHKQVELRIKEAISQFNKSLTKEAPDATDNPSR